VAALPGQADRLAGTHALGHPYLQGLAVDADAHAVAAVERLKRHRQARAAVATRLRPTRATGAGAAAAASEQFLEEVAEAAAGTTAGEDLVVVETAGPRAVAKAARWRLHLVAGAVAARAQLVVGLAPVRVAQRLVRLADGLEALLRVGLLAHVGVVLARQAAIGGLDLGLARAGLDPEDVVVVLELHGLPSPGRHRGAHYPRLRPR